MMNKVMYSWFSNFMQEIIGETRKYTEKDFEILRCRILKHLQELRDACDHRGYINH